MMLSNKNPGVGSYNICDKNLWPAPKNIYPSVVCFFQSAETCFGCERFLYGDYYQSSSGKFCLCLHCYKFSYDPVRGTPCFMKKVRHCFAYHKHINVENIVHHKTTTKQIRRLNLLEKRMWNKFGNLLN